ncbi:hypothetical protein Plhal304r1_c016g0059811 [Plasmopara halstedii]
MRYKDSRHCRLGTFHLERDCTWVYVLSTISLSEITIVRVTVLSEAGPSPWLYQPIVLMILFFPSSLSKDLTLCKSVLSRKG